MTAVVLFFLGRFYRLKFAGGLDRATRAGWFHELCREVCQVLRIDSRFAGLPPQTGVLVCNHLSYLDILVLASKQPMIFASKSEVRRWPVIGSMAMRAGTIFLERDRKTNVPSTLDEIYTVLREGLVVVLFLEGTSSGGDSVLPFRSSLLEPAAKGDWPVVPAAIHYQLLEGSVSEEICYWGDMTFLPHLLNVLTKTRIQAFVAFGTPLAERGERKNMAQTLHREVVALFSGAVRKMAKEASISAPQPGT